MPTRSLRSETGCQAFEAFGSTGCFSKPWIGFSSAGAVWPNSKAAVANPRVCRNDRRVLDRGGKAPAAAKPVRGDRRRAEFMGRACVVEHRRQTENSGSSVSSCGTSPVHVIWRGGPAWQRVSDSPRDDLLSDVRQVNRSALSRRETRISGSGRQKRQDGRLVAVEALGERVER